MQQTKEEMLALGENNEFVKEKTFSYKRLGDHQMYVEKLYFKTVRRK